MKPYEIYNLIVETTYTKTGDSLDWAVITKDSEKAIYLLFQQSDGKIDWRNNFNFFEKRFNLRDKLYVARGWGNAWKSANDTVMDALIKAHTTNADYEIIIAGWSYGGAIAPLACEDFWYRTGGENGGIQSTVITFGAPKPLYGKSSVEYAMKSVKAVYQYAHVNDIVPLCPPVLNYYRLNTVYVGTGKSIFRLLNPWKYHTMYGSAKLYE